MAQPLSLGIIIMISSLFLCVLTALTLSSWYAYILFLIYVGGLLVIFAYVAALSPNILFTGGGPLIFFVTLALIRILTLYFLPLLDFRSLELLSRGPTFKTLKAYGAQLLSRESAFTLIRLGLILLINLVVVVKVCFYQHSSLRPFN